MASVSTPPGKPLQSWRLRLYTIIFESDTRAGRWFDQCLILFILFSVAVVVADSVPYLHERLSGFFSAAEWIFTLLFTLEYLARLACAPHPWRYARSFFGVIDLLALLPTYLALLLPGAHVLIDVRVLRLLRIFRVFKLTAYMTEYRSLAQALHASRRKITVFITGVLMVVLVMGTLMYVVEGPANGFTTIPTAVYWAITTMTTVGFGDITPKTDLGRFISSMMMLLGWGTLAVPTGIVTAEIAAQRQASPTTITTTRTCPECMTEGHLPEARYCLYCGAALPPWAHDEASARRA
nr:potassium voltage-gated channel subfamily KQT [uncultured bacterium]